jgi:uncharacterized membrane protein YfcA
MLIVAGLLTGLLIGLSGVGGGSLMTPLLLLVFGVAPGTAVGTDLWFAAATKSVAVASHRHSGLIDWQVVRLPQHWLSRVIALCLLAVGSKLVFA